MCSIPLKLLNTLSAIQGLTARHDNDVIIHRDNDVIVKYSRQDGTVTEGIEPADLKKKLYFYGNSVTMCLRRGY